MNCLLWLLHALPSPQQQSQELVACLRIFVMGNPSNIFDYLQQDLREVPSHKHNKGNCYTIAPLK